MILEGVVSDSENVCLNGNINLITGEYNVWKTACRIIN